jgi:hypothetical protein
MNRVLTIEVAAFVMTPLLTVEVHALSPCPPCHEPNDPYLIQQGSPPCVEVEPPCWDLEPKGENRNDSSCPPCEATLGCPQKVWQIIIYKPVASCAGFASTKPKIIIFKKEYPCDYTSIDWYEATVLSVAIGAKCMVKCSVDMSDFIISCMPDWLRGNDCKEDNDIAQDCLDCIKELLDPCRLYTGCSETGDKPFEFPAWTAEGQGVCP